MGFEHKVPQQNNCMLSVRSNKIPRSTTALIDTKRRGGISIVGSRYLVMPIEDNIMRRLSVCVFYSDLENV
jgi:hypothetical protein